jgi:LuxR family maltose regulon positive regulatory protein
MTRGSLPSVPLLATKLFIPHIRPNVVPRPRLLARLDAGIHGPLTLLSAPAGWGKTTVLGEWQAHVIKAGADIPPVAWVTLDGSDNDPVRFWTYILTALNAVQAGIADMSLELLSVPQPPPIQTTLTPLLNALAAEPRHVVLVLDDYHTIVAPQVHVALAFLIDHLPTQLHVVLATREDPPLPLARWRAQRGMTEVRAADLRFTFEETAAFMAATLDMALPAEAVFALDTRSEGWIVGLQLAALSMQGRSREQVEAFIAAFSGSNRYIVDYLAEEVLARQPVELQDFLLRTAVLDRFCAPLCQAMLAHADTVTGTDTLARAGATGANPSEPAARQKQGASSHSPSAQTLLEWAERANLFLIPLDDDRRWFRYHHLFADFLRVRLRQADPELYRALHKRASVWFTAEGLIEEAMPHALNAADFARAGDLVERYGLAVAMTGRVEMVLGWLRALPEALIRSRPMLCVCDATMLFLRGEAEQAVEKRLRDAEAAMTESRRASMEDANFQPVRGIVALVRAQLARLRGELCVSVPLAREALDLLPETDAVWRAMAWHPLNESFELTGEVAIGSERTLIEQVASARASGRLQSMLAGSVLLGRLERLQGRLRKAAATYREAVEAIPGSLQVEDLHAGPGCILGLGEVQLEWNDLNEAERLLAREVQMLARSFVPALSVTKGYLAMARLLQARGEGPAALATLDAFAELAERRAFVRELHAQVAAMRAQVRLAQGDLASALHWREANGLAPDDANLAYPREREYLTLVRVLIAEARTDPSRQAARDALRLLDRLLADAAAKGRGHSVLEIRILRALAQQVRRDPRGAVGTLAQALEQAQPEGYVRLFADEGIPMAALLTKVVAAANQRRLMLPEAILDYAHVLLAACRAEGGGTPVPESVRSLHPSTDMPPLLDPLTAREVEVLRLLAEGIPNAAIAAKLVVTVGTVKKHVSNVYAKLGVQNRTQAVARARALHLL